MPNSSTTSTTTTTPPAPIDPSDRTTVIAVLRQSLRARSGVAWRVYGGRGTAYGWITITAPRADCPGGVMSETRRADLAALLGVDVHHQGVHVPASSDYRREYLARARGEAPTVVGRPYWD